MKKVTYIIIFILLISPLSITAQDFNKTIKLWDVKKASRNVEKQEHKPYTIMLYMNGSDLESEAGAATDDLIQIMDSGMDSKNVHFIVFTGGTKRWQNKVIPANECVLWEIADGELFKISGVGKVNMGNPGTLASFISFGLQNYPAEKYGLILWDHGGGSIAGYGHDEKFNDSSLSLLDMKNAFEHAGLRENKLEFLGFDSCLMASVEMAVVASDYANILIASEDLEPGEGWNYNFLTEINRNPYINGKQLGIKIVDYFMAYYGKDSDEILSLSVADLNHAQAVMDSVGELMRLGRNELINNRPVAFADLAERRVRTKTFGEGSPRDNECDMVDIGDMAHTLMDLYPTEAAAVLAALDKCVIYNKHNSDTDIKGLSTYYIFGGKEWGDSSLSTYASLNVNESYTQYLRHFFDALTGSPRTRSRTRSMVKEDVITENVIWQPLAGKKNEFRLVGFAASEVDGYVSSINQHPVCLFPVSQSEKNRQYAIPAEINGQDCDIIVLFNEKYPQGLIEGARHRERMVVQKGYDPIAQGDRVAFYSLEYNGTMKTQWKKSQVFKIREELQLNWDVIPMDYYSGFRITDIRGDERYTKPERVSEVLDNAA